MLAQSCVLHLLLGDFAHVSVMYGFKYKWNVSQEPKAAGALVCRIQYFFLFFSDFRPLCIRPHYPSALKLVNTRLLLLALIKFSALLSHV